ncbi:TRAP dicarboxylate transporter, DctP subunit [Thermosinus carboxydivorans Nor1]|uniref:TRAP dicarboxylate transporter, DctP subunit n=1 Tax=Thermosinus carboxydivorans Nor1 TaxID=401526 RepID=A1HSQ4_9FIRM|nr:TRAP transporter substrate-binding protein [Thermosinus carboxydivorans]EAX46935.1 TRAP dicarboxylate transporter, DctP subunit [Thermosinus carboxydivorans Nor1]
MWKKVSALVMAAALVVSLAGCGGSGKQATQGGQAAQPRIVKIANYFPPTHPQNVALREKFKPLLEQRTNGAFKVEIYDNNQLGSEKDFINGVSMGTIEMAVAGLLQAEMLPRLKIPEMPYLFRDYDHAMKVLNGPIGEEITKGMIEKGTRPLAWNVNGFRAVSNSKHPIKTLADTRDIKLRVPTNSIFIDGLQALGFNTVSMPMTELFSALQQKIVDGQENPPATLLTSGWYEVQKYLTLTNHIMGPNVIMISEKFWQTLTPEQQKIFKEVAVETAKYEVELMKKFEPEAVATLKQKGIQVDELADRAEWEKAVQPVYEKWYKQYPEFKDIVTRIKETK